MLEKIYSLYKRYILYIKDIFFMETNVSDMIFMYINYHLIF